MKLKITAILMAAVLIISLTSCTGKRGGASSPEALFNNIIKVQADETKAGKISPMVQFISPEDRVILAFSMDMMAAFMGMVKKSIAAEQKVIREKHKISDQTKSMSAMNQADLKDMNKLRKVCQEIYGHINDISAYIGEMEALTEKATGKVTKTTLKFKELKNLKIDQDKAAATAVMSNGTKKKINFIKVDGSWYLTVSSVK